MISVSKRSESSKPTVLSSDACLNKIAEVIANPDTVVVRNTYNNAEVKEALESIHGEKCVYCESYIKPASWYRVDHYRPKKHIQEIPKKNHKGYYWLSLEWTNLLLSCEVCNGSKSNKFPLMPESYRVPDVGYAHVRLFKESPLSDEKRLLLHPEYDEVEKYLIFEDNGKVSSSTPDIREDMDMGQTSIRVYGLNRDSLILTRKQKVEKYWYKLLSILNDYEDDIAEGNTTLAQKILFRALKNYFKELLAEQHEKQSYSRLGYYMFHNFKSFYLDRLMEYPDYKLVEEYYDGLLKFVTPHAL